MIKLSTRGRYGLRAMIELASAAGNDTPLMMSEISSSQGVSRKYLHALLAELREASLVVSRRGVRGGYLLARPAEEIRISEIIFALEGDLCLVACVEDAEICKRSTDCAARGLWVRVSAAVDGVLDGTTLADLAETKRRPEKLTSSRRRHAWNR